MLFIRMAWKNMFRYKNRTMITSCAIAIGVMLSIIMNGLLFGIDTESQRNLQWYETSSAKIFADGYFAEKDFLPQYFIDRDVQKNIEKILNAEKIQFTKRYQGFAEIYFNEEFFVNGGSISAILTGIDPVSDAQVFHIAEKIESGTWLESNESMSSEGVVIGSWLAEDIGAQVGYYVTVQCRGRGGFYQTFDVPIVGITHTENPVINSTGVFMDIAYLDEMLELEGGVTEYALAENLQEVLSDVKINSLKGSIEQIGFLEMFSWRDLAFDVLQLAEAKNSTSALLLIFVFIIATVGITNTMLMAVMERRKEIGMLKALGYKDKDIRLLFMCEGLFIGFAGSAVGFMLGIAANALLSWQGLDFSFMLRDTNIGYRISGVMYSAWNMKVFVSIFFAAIGISTIVAWFPSKGILKNEIAYILRKN